MNYENEILKNSIRFFLKGHFKSTINTNDVNFTIENKDNLEYEFQKLFYLRSLMYLDNDDKVYYYIFNKGLLVFKNEVIDFLSELYDLSKYNIDRSYFLVICEFLFSYGYSIKSKEYNIRSEKNSDDYFYKRFLRKLFYDNGEIKNNALEFYSLCFESIITKEYIVYSLELEFILKVYKNKIDYFDKLKQLISLKIHLPILVEYDLFIDDNYEIYFDYIKENLDYSYKGESSFNLFLKLLKINKIHNNDLIYVINYLIVEINKFSLIVKEKDKKIINLLSDFDSLLNRVNKINQCKITANNKIKLKLKEMNKFLLFNKRKLLSNEQEINESLHRFSFKIDLPQNEVEKTVKLLKDNPLSFVNLFIQNYNKLLESAIKNDTEHPLLNLITVFKINPNDQSYQLNKSLKFNNISHYYNEIGSFYVINHSNEFLNKPNENYYNSLLNYLEISTLNFHAINVHLIESNLESFGKTIEEILHISSDKNIYISIVKMILKTETNLLKIAKLLNIEIIDVKQVIDELFLRDDFKLEDNFYKNGLMFIYYHFYSSDGTNIRNLYAHGNAFSLINHEIFYWLSLTSLVFSTYILQNIPKEASL